MKNGSTRRRLNRLLFAAAPLFLVAGAAPAAAVSDTQRQNFYEYCASCHGPMGRGDGPVAGELKTRPTDLTQLAKNNNGQFPYVRVAAVRGWASTARPRCRCGGSVSARKAGPIRRCAARS
jgi:mono/diheme cytochrome c family protein